MEYPKQFNGVFIDKPAICMCCNRINLSELKPYRQQHRPIAFLQSCIGIVFISESIRKVYIPVQAMNISEINKYPAVAITETATDIHSSWFQSILISLSIFE